MRVFADPRPQRCGKQSRPQEPGPPPRAGVHRSRGGQAVAGVGVWAV